MRRAASLRTTLESLASNRCLRVGWLRARCLRAGTTPARTCGQRRLHPDPNPPDPGCAILGRRDPSNAFHVAIARAYASALHASKSCADKSRKTFNVFPCWSSKGWGVHLGCLSKILHPRAGGAQLTLPGMPGMPTAPKLKGARGWLLSTVCWLRASSRRLATNSFCRTAPELRWPIACTGARHSA